MRLDYPELSMGANLVLQHIDELQEEDQLTRENLEEKVEENFHLDEAKLDEILDEIDEDQEITQRDMKEEILKNNQ